MCENFCTIGENAVVEMAKPRPKLRVSMVYYYVVVGQEDAEPSSRKKTHLVFYLLR